MAILTLFSGFFREYLSRIDSWYVVGDKENWSMLKKARRKYEKKIGNVN